MVTPWYKLTTTNIYGRDENRNDKVSQTQTYTRRNPLDQKNKEERTYFHFIDIFYVRKDILNRRVLEKMNANNQPTNQYKREHMKTSV